jgi:hypothetical protein
VRVPRPNPTASVAAAAALAAVVARTPRALGDSFWQDEVASARILREPTFPAMLGHVTRTESTPPLWYTLGWLAHQAGVSIHDVRLLSVAAGGLLAAVSVVYAARLVPLPAAALAGALVVFGAQFTAHGHELRSYELFALLAVVFALTLDGAAQRPSPRRLAAVTAATAAAALTHYFFAFTAAAALAWLWLEPRARPARARLTLAIAAGLALCLPWTPMFLAQFRHDGFWWIGPFRGELVVATPLRLFTPLFATRIAAPIAAATVAGAAFLLALRGPRARLCVALGLLPVVLAALTWLIGFQVYAVRNLLAAGPFIAVALGAIVAALPRRAGVAAAATAAAVVAGGFVRDQAVPAAPYEELAHALVEEGWRPHDPVVVFGSYYAYRSPLSWYLPHAPRLALARDAAGTCPAVFAIGGRRLRRPPGDADVIRSERVGRFEVVRLDPGEPIARDPLFHGGRLLALPPLRCGARRIRA